MESILSSIKKMLGYSEEQTSFDTDIIIHINSVFANLNQLGVGPEEVFSIVDETAIWDDFIQDNLNIQNVKTYMYLNVKILFDPPASSAVLSSYERAISMLEFRLNIEADKT